MNEIENTGNQPWSPTQMGQQKRPASPDYNSEDRIVLNSDDLQPTSQLYPSSLYDNEQRTRRASRSRDHYKFVVVVGSYDKPITLGRGGANTIKIGRRNRNISRTHISISYNKTKQQFELTVLGLNGVCVDDVAYDQHAVVPLQNESFIDVLGDQIQFREPAPQLLTTALTKPMVEKIEKMNDREMSPEPEKEQQEAIVKERMEVDSVEDKQTSTTTMEEMMNGKSVVEQEEAAGTKPYDESTGEESRAEASQQVALMTMQTAIESEETKSSTAQTDEPAEANKDEKAENAKDDSVPETKKRKKSKETKKTEDKSILREKNSPAPAQQDVEKKEDYSEVIIDALVFSRTSSMPISDICSRILKANPAYAEHSREVWIERIRKVLKEKPFFGEIQRKGKAADGTPVENLYYYNSELDPVEWRRATYTQVGRSARKCTLKDKQYFWKIPPKLGRHRSSYVPPPAENHSNTSEHTTISTTPAKRQRSSASADENNEPKKIEQ